MITIDKVTERKNGKVRVTFAMPATEGCGRLYLVGKFGEWNESVYCMECDPDGTWSLTLELDPGHVYEYRFRTIDGKWLNDATPLPVPAPFQSQGAFISRPASTV